ncbi:MAG: adenylate cyclase [Ruminiclostridium sp.]|nr:adenylate cyclase [Ruminiclostridium sp.]
MPTIRATSLRLNLDKPEHRQAWEYLQALDNTEFKSYTSAIVTAVNDYFGRYFRRKDDPYLETREREEKFVAEIVAAVERSAEKALPAFLAACIAKILKSNGNFSVPAQNSAPAEKVENDDISDVDLDFIGG